MLFFKDIKKDFNLLEKINIQNKLFYIIVINFLTSVIEMISLASLVPLVGIVMKGEIPEKFNWIFAYEFLQDNNNFLILVGLIILVKTIFVISTAYYKENSIKLISIKLSDYIFLKFFNKDWDYISKKNTSFFVKNILNEVDVYSKYLNSQLTFFAEFFILIFVLFFLLFMQPIITIIVITFFSFIFALGYSIVKKNIKRLGETREFSQKKILQRIIETISNYPLIKIFKQKNFFLKEFSNDQKIFKNSLFKINFLNILPRQIFEYFILTSLILYLIYYNFLNNGFKSELVNIIIIFSVAAYRLIPSISRISQTLQTMAFTKISKKILHNLIVENDYQYKETENNKKIEAITSLKKITINNLSFSYKTDSEEIKILDNLNFEIIKGNLFGIIGPSGVGKSTLLKILMGFLNYKDGTILINNTNFKNININEWFNKISYVPQDVFIHNDTIKNNIVFGDQKFDEKQFDRVIKICLLDKLIDNMNDGYNTILQDGGKNLSGGQIQRIGIARALYKKPEIIFLDEPTSNLDNNAELKIIDTLKSLTPDITVVMISHREKAILKCDQVLNLS
jgi:ABC-type bacteriocin/lantibiotic exporter with double-glycine peptidase domain